MKAILPFLMLVLAAVVLPAPAQASHVCHVDDVSCVAQCVADSLFVDDPCAVYEPVADVAFCSSGVGVTYDTGSNQGSVCTSPPSNPVSVEDCEPYYGYVVSVGDRVWFNGCFA